MGCPRAFRCGSPIGRRLAGDAGANCTQRGSAIPRRSCPVGVIMPVAWLIRNTVTLSLSWWAQIRNCPGSMLKLRGFAPQYWCPTVVSIRALIDAEHHQVVAL